MIREKLKDNIMKFVSSQPWDPTIGNSHTNGANRREYTAGNPN